MNDSTLLAELNRILAQAQEQYRALLRRDTHFPYTQRRTKVEVRWEEATKLLKQRNVGELIKERVDGVMASLDSLRERAIAELADQRLAYAEHLRHEALVKSLVERCIRNDKSLLDPWIDKGRYYAGPNPNLDKCLKYIHIHVDGVLNKLNAFSTYDRWMGFDADSMRYYLHECISYRYFKMLSWARGYEGHEAVRQCFRRAINSFYSYGARIASSQGEQRTREQTRSDNEHRSWHYRNSQQGHYSDLPNDELGLRRILMENHPDRNVTADTTLFQRAKNKLDSLRARF